MEKLFDFTGNTKADKELNTHETLSSKLYNALRKNGKITRAFKLHQWSHYFKMLNEKYPEETIQNVLQFFLHNITNKNLPKIYSAKTFSINFHKLQEYMNSIPDSSPASPESLSLTAKLMRLHWPNGIDRMLPSIIERSKENYAHFLSLLNNAMRKLEVATRNGDKREEKVKSKKLLSLIDKLTSTILMQPKFFLELWMEKVHRRIEKWQDYSGDSRWLVFTVKHPVFEAICRDITYTYCGDSRRFDQLMEFVNGSSNSNASK